MVPTRLERSWLLRIFLGLLVLCVPAVAHPADQQRNFGRIPMSPEVYQRYLKITPSREMRSLAASLPPAYNAAALGFVTPAKDQGSCAACYAFAAVGAMESKLLMVGFRPNGSPPDLSEQQLVSCDTGQFGCGGGYIDAALFFWGLPPNADSGPLPESVFPYAEADVPCRNPSRLQVNYRAVDFYTVPLDVDEFKASLYQDGPGVVGILVMGDFFTFWKSAPPGSVYTYRDGDIEASHAVELIGWDDAKQAFLLKNSVGEHAGPNGDGTFWASYASVGWIINEMMNFRITEVDAAPQAPRPVPTTSYQSLAMAAGWLLLIGRKALRRRV